MQTIKFMVILMLLIGFKSHAQLQLVDLNDLEQGMEHHQEGKIPVFNSALLNLADESQPKVVKDNLYDIYDNSNLLASIDGQLVVFPKDMIAVSNGFTPFKNLMEISNGYFQLERDYGVAIWNIPSISNGYFYFRGFASLKTVQKLKDTANTLTLTEINSANTPTTLVSYDPDEIVRCSPFNNCWDDQEYIWKLQRFIKHIEDTAYTSGGRVMVLLDGVMVEMSVAALRAHLLNGVFLLKGH